MSAVVGIDLSSFAIDLVKLDEDTNRAEWRRCVLEGGNAWERTLSLHHTLRNDCGDWWPDVYLVAIEAPYGGGPGTQAILNRVVGAVSASIPAQLRRPERCWVVRPDEWKGGLGLKAKPSDEDLERIAGTPFPFTGSPFREPVNEHARDAYCLAMWARDTNAAAVSASSIALEPASQRVPVSRVSDSET